eukprot:jgi/Ulvmu1/6130/UM027_0108.1
MNILIRPLSWLLGLLDILYYLLFLKPGKKNKKFFEEGYGDVNESVALRDTIRDMLPKLLDASTPAPEPAVVVIKELMKQRETLLSANETSLIQAVDGTFVSPVSVYMPGESKHCHFQLLKPPKGVAMTGVCIMMPATGDVGSGFRRRLYADALALQGIVGLIPTAPFYGRRKPAAQDKIYLRTVHETFVQAYATATEAACLLHWAHAVWGKPVAVTGASFGGAMAALVSRLYPGRLAVVPYMGCDGPGDPFSRGLFQSSVAWDALEKLPEHPELSLPHRETGAADTPVEKRFEEYCNFFTNTHAFGPLIPAEMSGKHVLIQLQCRDDRIVAYDNGLALYEDLQRIALGTHEHVADATDKKVVYDDDDAEVPAAEFVEVAGGHCSGFLRCPVLLPAAVIRALARLEMRHYDN